MSWIFAAVVVGVLYTLVRLAARSITWLLGSRFGVYHRIASEFGGRYESRGLSEPPTVSFRRPGALVRVGLAPTVPGQAVGPRTRVVIRFDEGLPFRMELTPIHRATPPQPPKGTRLVRVGDSVFDRAFVVRANDPEMARDFLAAPIRWSVENVLRLGPTGGMIISINPERLLIQVDRDLSTRGEALSMVVREALVLLEGLQSGVATRLAEGVAIVAAGAPAAEDAGPATCKVCGEPIEGMPSVTCATCKTPHHLDCWEFIGACSVFGCQGKVARPS